ncbi:MAG: glycosyltransferase family 4 protein, partial [Acidobacteriota bacterium]
AELAIGCVHAHALPVLLAVAEAAGHPLGATPLIVTLHDLSHIDPCLFTTLRTEPRADPDWIARCAPVLRAARTVIVPSDYLARQTRIHYPDVVPLVIPNGIAAAPREQLPLAPPWPEDAQVFAVVGALGPHKGSETLLRVASALTDPNIVGVVIGYTELHLTPGWVVPGRLYVHGRYHPDELPGLLTGYRVRLAYFPNVVPESFSYALSEAWQAGTPALVPAFGALGERVRATGAGWLLDDPLDANAAATAIERLLGPAGAPELAAAAQRLGAPASCVPGVAAMRASVAHVYRTHASPSRGDADGGWVRLRTRLRPQLLSSAEDCALDAEWPALVREEHTLRDWNGKLTRDVATLGQRSIDLDSDVVALKERNTLVEADLFALKQRNTHVEQDAAALQIELAVTRERFAHLEQELAIAREHASRFERMLALVPPVIKNWLSRRAR